MPARFPLLILVVALLAALGGWFLGRSHRADATGTPSAATERKIKFYQSPMHPWITSDRPGKCTLCGMDLVPVYEGDAGFAASSDLVQLSAATAAIIGVATSPVATGPATRTLAVTGLVEDDDTRHTLVTAWTDLRIQKLHTNQIGQHVAAGAPLAEVYARDLHLARQEYHSLATTAAPHPALLAAARTRLLQLGLLPGQLDALANAATVAPETTLLAPASGTVITRSPLAYVGANVPTGTLLFELADLRRMWVILDIPEIDLAALRPGLPVTLHLPGDPESPREARIDFIEPNVNERTRTARARVVLDNAAGHLRHRQSLTATLHFPLGEHLLVPRSAVLFTRAQPLVFLDRDGAYAATPVTLDPTVADEGYLVRTGLRAGDRVVTRAALLIEGQAQLAFTPTAPAATTTAAAFDPAALPALTPLAFAAADASAALAADDLPAFAAALPALRETYTAFLAAAPATAEAPLAAPYADLVPGPDLRAARRAFEPFSTTLADLVRAAGLHHDGTLRVFECPMTPVLGTGRWVQRTAALRNPFFGATMLECGEELR